MQKEKISKAITSALAYIEATIDIQPKGNEERVMQLIWRAASNLEYSLFLFSLRYSKENRSQSWRVPTIKQLEVEHLLASTQELLNEATQNIESDDLREAHKKTWIARGHLFRIHDLIKKKNRKS